ncbi:hypothetical protein ABL78_5492 [Leptomonas seymouri]|uniref:RRM domain-containing protein n=1 Tax=Leptomonas seymouri TaxID=5684 RepID=A0A0N1HV30_LEPSE|nr:hypothetical protein ABL78_5492 [Leptomonas seymouri]|eukprot:KPI85438.1 hypothetical protein ABL78_5492 [Leptomonas seymouri]
MYGFFSSPGNPAPAQSTTSPQPIQSSQSQPPPHPTQVFFTSPPPGAAPNESPTQRHSFALYNVTSGPQHPQSMNYATSTDPQWPGGPHLYSSVAPLSAPIKMVAQRPNREAYHDSTEYSAASRPYSSNARPPPPMAVLAHDAQISQSSTAPTTTPYAAFVGADPPLGYQLAATAATFTPLYLRGVGDSHGASLNMGRANYVDNASNSSVLYPLLNSCTTAQLPPQQQQLMHRPPQLASQPQSIVSSAVPVSAAAASDAVPLHPPANSPGTFSAPNAREPALDSFASFFSGIGATFAQSSGQQQQHPQGTSSRFALQQLSSHPQTAFHPMSAANAQLNVETILVEQPMSQHGAQQFLHQVDRVQAAMASHMRSSANPTAMTNTAVQHHFNPVVDKETRRFPQSYVRRTRLSFADAPPRAPLSPAQQQQTPYPSHTHVHEYPRPAAARTDRTNSSSSALNERPPRCSSSSGPAYPRRPTRTSLSSLNSAVLGNSVNDSHAHQHPPQHRGSATALAMFEPSPQPHSDEQKQPPQLKQQQQRDELLSMMSVSTNTNTTISAPPPPPPPPSAASPPPAPSHSIARRNRDKAVLFVGQLNYEATEADVAQIFSCYGKPLSVVVLKDKGKSSRRSSAAASAAARGGAPQRKVGGSAFVNYGSTLEADTAIMALHGRYNAKDDDPDNDDEAKYLQVSYAQQTGLISPFGTMRAEKLHALKPENPIPLIVLEQRKASAMAAPLEASVEGESKSDCEKSMKA